ncbi:MAG: hypothetical protein ACXWFY_04290 [Chthoniobacterales bacterium]
MKLSPATVDLVMRDHFFAWNFLAYANKANPIGLKVFFSLLLLLVLAAGLYILRNRKKFFGFRGDASDTYASANLRMWLVILVWIHAVVITALMIYEV